MAAYEKHRDFIQKVSVIHSSSGSPQEYRERIERERVYEEYKALVLELRRVKNENMGKLTPEETREVEREGNEVNEAYLRMAGEGIIITEKMEWF